MAKITVPSGTVPRSAMLAYVTLLLLCAVLFLMNFRFFITDGPSMEPTYTERTLLLASKSYTAPQVGDVVFLKYKGVYCMKRIAFVAGEDVTQAGYESYWGSPTVPEGYVYVLGDNAEESLDSRDPSFGLVSISDIWGKPLDQRQKGE